MKKFTIKALFLSLSILFVSNTKCVIPGPAIANAAGVVVLVGGAIVTVAVVGIVGGTILAAKWIFSPERRKIRKERRKKIAKKRKKRKEEKKSRILASKKINPPKASLLSS